MSVHSGPLDIVPSPCNQFGLPLPPGVAAGFNAEQSARLARVQLQFAQDVALLLQRAFAEVSRIAQSD